MTEIHNLMSSAVFMTMTRCEVLALSPLPQCRLADLHHTDHIFDCAAKLVHASRDQES